MNERACGTVAVATAAVVSQRSQQVAEDERKRPIDTEQNLRGGAKTSMILGSIRHAFVSDLLTLF